MEKSDWFRGRGILLQLMNEIEIALKLLRETRLGEDAEMVCHELVVTTTMNHPNLCALYNYILYPPSNSQTPNHLSP